MPRVLRLIKRCLDEQPGLFKQIAERAAVVRYDARDKTLSSLALALCFNPLSEDLQAPMRDGLKAIDLSRVEKVHPEALSSYMQRAFAKCLSTDERQFMVVELSRLFQRCRERGILFTRNWSTVTEPCLVRESPMTYAQINANLLENDQGVVQRVQEVSGQQQ